MVTKDYSKSRMRENRTYGSVRGGQSNLILSTRLTGLWPRGFLSLTAAMPLRVVEGAFGAVGIGGCRDSRRGLRLRRRGAYGIHRASGPWCQGLCRKVASLRSGGRRLAVRKTIEYQIGALPCTPFPAVREFAPVGSMSLDSRVAGLPYESSSFATSRGNERYEEKNRGVICFMYYSSISPFGGWCYHLPTSSWWDYGYLAMEPCLCRKA